LIENIFTIIKRPNEDKTNLISFVNWLDKFTVIIVVITSVHKILNFREDNY